MNQRAAVKLYRLLLPYENDCATVMAMLSAGPVALYLGRLAGLLGHVKAARRHYEAAIEISQRICGFPG